MPSAISSTRVPESVLTMPMVGAVPPPRRTGSARSVTPGSAGRRLLARRPRVGVQKIQRRTELRVVDLLGHLPRRLGRQPAHGLHRAGVGVPEVAAEVPLPE